jgi:purine-binding chemotaxis protein CheW
VSTLHVVFKVADAEYAIPASEVLHMESYNGATPVPGAPAFVAGLIQVRGRVLPVVDVRARFGLPPAAPTLESRVVVVKVQERVTGLLVDSAREVLNLSEDQFQPPPSVIARDGRSFVSSVVRAGPRLLMLVDHRKIIGEALEESQHGQ